MKIFIHTNTSAEPGAFHGDENKIFYAVHLAAEVCRDAATDTEADAKEVFADFLGKAPTFKYALVPDIGLGVAEAVDVEATAGSLGGLMDWLEQRDPNAAGASDPEPYYLTPTAEPAVTDTFDAATVGAAQLLRSTLNWIGPVPERLGLTRLIAQDSAPSAQAAIIPYLGATPPASVVTDGSTITYDLAGTLGGISEVSVVFEELGDYTAPSSIVLPDGSVEAVPADPEFRRTLNRIDAESAGRLWTVPHMLEPYDDVDWSSLDARKWLADAGLKSAFDPLFWSLAMPATLATGELAPRGQIMLPFIAFLAGANERFGHAAGVDADQAWSTWRPRLRTVLSSLSFADLVGLLRDVEAVDPETLGVLEDAEAGEVPDDGKTADERVAQLRETLNAAVVALQEEAAVEAVIVALLRKVADSSALEPTAERPAFDAAMRAFGEFLEEGFNGADAVRRSVGSIISRELVLKASRDLDALNESLAEADLFARRLLGRTGTPQDLDQLLDALPDSFAGVAPATLRARLQERYREVATMLSSPPAAEMRFVPDTSPQPLAIRILPGMDVAELTEISSALQGFGVVINSKIRGDEDAGHGNLVRVNPGSSTIPTAVQPLIPGLSDGRPVLFAEYNGRPLAGASQTGIGGRDAIEDAEQRAARELASRVYYNLDEAEEEDLLPADLAYGAQYAAKAFWTPNSGRLPAGLRDGTDPSKPVKPAGDFKPQIPDGAAYYLRRTAISETGLSEVDARKRISVVPADVFPLASDYPRIAKSAPAEATGYIDVFRNGDGTGALPDGTASIVLVDALVVGAGAEVQLRRCWDPTGADEGIEFAATLAGNGSDETLQVPADSDARPFWVRVVLTAGSGEGATLSFADPSDDAELEGKPATAPILLLAQGDEWQSEIARENVLELSVPRVSFADFERWAANRELFVHSTGNTDDRLPQVLLVASMMRHLSETIDELIEQLPDPAVSALHLGLQVTDAFDGFHAEPKFFDLPVAPYAGFDLDAIATALDELERAGAMDQPAKARVLMDLLEDLLRELDRKARPRLTAEVGGLQLDARRVGVPAGKVVHLSAQPVVAETYFDNGHDFYCMEPRLTEIAAGRLEDAWLFPGVALQIEAMQLPELGLPAEDWWRDARIAPLGRTREYGLDLDLTDYASRPFSDPAFNFWRQFAQADVATQRWRPTGRPIYHWIRPVSAVGGIEHVSGPVVDLSHLVADPSQKSLLFEFESDAFDRDVDESDIVRVRLDPVDRITRLNTFSWEQHSATARRHRIDLRTRYWGGLRNPSARPMVAPPSEPPRADDDLWTNRAAILADLSVLELTRPQVRALLPLTRRVGDAGSALPIACLLAEKPFDQAGLADRIAAEIDTVEKFRFYDLDSTAGDRRLGLETLRKEVGPDPRLSYYGIGDQPSRKFSLMCEGPVGLHFEAVDAAAPAFTNSQYLLHMRASGDDVPGMDESFAGISLRRYVDPDWSWSPYTAAPESLPDVWWQDLLTDEMFTDFLVTYENPQSGQTVSAVSVAPSADGQEFVFRLATEAIYPTPGELDGAPSSVELCRVAVGQPASVLFQKLDASRYAFSVFVPGPSPTQTAVEVDGASGLPILLASMDWTAMGPVTVSGEVSMKRAITASAATFVEWARSGRDFQKFVATPLQEDAEGSTVQQRDIEAVWDRTERRIALRSAVFDDAEIRLSSLTGQEPYPLHVQRHLAILLTKASPALGREVPLFDRILLSDGAGIPLAGDDPDPGATLRLVEYETRAEVLTSDRSHTVEYFHRAYFDLVSIGADTRLQSGDGFRFHLRLTNGSMPKDIAPVLHMSGAGAPEGETPIALSARTPDELQALTVELVLSDAADTWNWRATGRTKNGPVELDGGTVDLPFLAAGEDGVWLRLEAPGPGLWADVSMLFSRAKAEEQRDAAFDFDWLFTADTLPRKATEAVMPENLVHMSEAQAKIIAVSDPIVVQTR
ncbi:MAG: hypothetical protein AAF441_00045 [Pseudomonadota bacterium]